MKIFPYTFRQIKHSVPLQTPVKQVGEEKAQKTFFDKVCGPCVPYKDENSLIEEIPIIASLSVFERF